MHWNAQRLFRINQIKLTEDFVLCVNCQEYLSPPIWSLTGTTNVCNSCKIVVAHMEPNQNHFLEQILSTLKYPCTGPSECQFVGSYNEAKEHSLNCKPSFTCTLCMHIVDNKHAVSHFLDEHCNGKVSLPTEGVFGPIKLWMPLKRDRVFMFKTGDTFYLLFVRILSDSKCALTLTKHIDTPCLDFARFAQDNFVLEWEGSHNSVKRRIKGKTSKVSCYFARKAKSFTIPMNLKERIELTITINGYNMAKGFTAEECPICFDAILDLTRTHRCANGHSVCSDCQRKVTNCPFCREPINIPVPVDNANMRCQNANCLHVVNKKQITQHVQLKCPYQSMQCPVCDGVMPRLSILGHLETAHKLPLNIYEFFIPSNESKHKHYILFRGGLFRLTIAVEGRWPNQSVGFLVQQIFVQDGEEPVTQYRYELHFYQKPSDVETLLKVGNACQLGDKDVMHLNLQAAQIPYAGKETGFFRLHFFSVDVKPVSDKVAIESLLFRTEEIFARLIL